LEENPNAREDRAGKPRGDRIDRVARRVAALLLLGLGSGCAPDLIFHCSHDPQCRRGQELGICQPIGFCSFGDPSCPSGQRYVTEADPSVHGACVAGAGATAPIPTPLQGLDYSLAFADDFDALDISPDGSGKHTWYNGLWYEQEPSPLSQIKDAESIVSLAWERGQKQGTSIATMARDHQSFEAWRYGYFEIRLRWRPVTGAWPSFWLTPVQAASGMTDVGELDVFAGQGSTPHTFYGDISEWSDQLQIWSNGGQNQFPLASDVAFSDFHVYGVLWTPGSVTWFFDGSELHTEATRSVFDVQDYYLVISMQEGVDFSEGDMTGVTTSSMTVDVDWVRVWRR
jgi:hypothetical protein